MPGRLLRPTWTFVEQSELLFYRNPLYIGAYSLDDKISICFWQICGVLGQNWK